MEDVACQVEHIHAVKTRELARRNGLANRPSTLAAAYESTLHKSDGAADLGRKSGCARHVLLGNRMGLGESDAAPPGPAVLGRRCRKARLKSSSCRRRSILGDRKSCLCERRLRRAFSNGALDELHLNVNAFMRSLEAALPNKTVKHRNCHHGFCG